MLTVTIIWLKFLDTLRNSESAQLHCEIQKSTSWVWVVRSHRLQYWLFVVFLWEQNVSSMPEIRIRIHPVIKEQNTHTCLHRQPSPTTHIHTQIWTQRHFAVKCNMFSQISTVKLLADAQHQSHAWNMTQEFQVKVSKLNCETFHNHRIDRIYS